MSKYRLKVLCCASASGIHKLRLENFKNVKKPPIDYYNQKAAWVV